MENSSTQQRPALQSAVGRCGKPFAAAMAGLAAAAILYAFNPAESSFFPPCLFHALTGLHCPGCGSMRGLHQLLHGNLTAALGMNALMVLSLPFLAYWALCGAVCELCGRRWPRLRLSPPWSWALIAGIVVFWVLRNVPCYPFSLLAP